jgi:hypothetical protein
VLAIRLGSASEHRISGRPRQMSAKVLVFIRQNVTGLIALGSVNGTPMG